MLRPMLYEQIKPALFSNQFNNFFDDFFSRFDRGSTDVLDKGDRYLLQAELPGFQKEDISVNLENDTLIIKANHQEEVNEEEGNYIRRERNTSSFQRVFSVADVDKENISAMYKNGILEVTLPKTNAAKESYRSIEIM